MYIVIELQKNNGQVANIVSSYEDLNTANNKYYTILAAAALSDIDAHSAVMLDDFGGYIKSECFTNNVQE